MIEIWRDIGSSKLNTPKAAHYILISINYVPLIYRHYTHESNSIFYSSDFNTTSFNWWMETTAEGGQAEPVATNATDFNRWKFT